MDIRPVRTEGDYEAALALVAVLVDADREPGTEGCDRLGLKRLQSQGVKSHLQPHGLLAPLKKSTALSA